MQSEDMLPPRFPARIGKRGMRALTVCAVLVFCAAPTAYAGFGVPELVPGPAPAPTPAGISSITSTFSPDRLGARGALTFSIHYDVGQADGIAPAESRVPAAVRKLTMRFPAGMGLDIPNLLTCSAARLRAHGIRGCSQASRVGSGHALTALPAGSQILTERITLSAFVGPLRNGQPTLAILAQGFTPLSERFVFKGEIRFDRAPYGEELIISVPPIHALPQTPDASPVLFSLTLGVNRHARFSLANQVIVPSRCPRGGFPFAAESTFADGSRGSALVRAACPPAHRSGRTRSR
ncbi:MAG TPA: hypothetical protein VGY76_01670 [Solirubrobacteraceae bacterium]|jgi:hypothetical protein|nr:hypothetical protein [Solirubrobacteraceae bacterium]